MAATLQQGASGPLRLRRGRPPRHAAVGIQSSRGRQKTWHPHRSSLSAQRTSSRAGTGGAPCRHRAGWGSTSRPGSIFGDCSATASRGRRRRCGTRSAARSCCSTSTASARLGHQDRRVGARQVLSVCPAHRRRRADRLGLRVGGGPPPALLRLAGSRQLPGGRARHARRPPHFGLMQACMREAGCANTPVGVDMCETAMLFSLQ